MPLVDLDKLKAEFSRVVWMHDVDGDIANGLLERAEAVDAVAVDGEKWLVTDSWPHSVYCPKCYMTNVPNEEWLFELNRYPKFCMWCGTKIDGGMRQAGGDV